MPKSGISDSTNRVRELFECALEIPSGQAQDAYLDAECGTDSVLRSEVQSLLRVHSQSDDFLSQTVAGDAISSLEGVLGSTIDRYRILELLGTGGFGEVYRAEQIEPIHREVALKIIKPGMGSREVIARFQAERQALALMDHPHIAHVYDAGTTESGRPYFAMELACGLPITRFCDDNRLSIEERIRLFQKVCRGVQHAHQKGIIHRDLKPSNIVVTRDDPESEPVPKVIDFGIAKSLQGNLIDATLISARATLMGTPAYMSPEQIKLGSENLDTRSDVYALGVILYELLAGSRPIETDEADGANFSEAQRRVCEVEPPRPSVRVRTIGESQETVARLRVTEPLALSRTLRHDLDWIVMKAIEKDRERRYQGAGELADDIGRYLLHQPVLAGPPTRSYRLGKFVRRHRAGVLATAAVIVALLAGLTASMVGFRQAVAQQKVTDQARTRAQEMVTFIMEDLHPQLRALGRQKSLFGSAGAAVRYFEQLPPELRDRETRRAHARALHLFARSFFYPVRSNAADYATLNAALEKARVLWPIVAAENPDDGEAAARADELLHFWDRNLSPAEDRASLEDLDRRFPENRSVQLYLAFRERQDTFYAGTRLSIEEAIAQGIAGLQRIDRFLAINPKDPDWRLEKAKLLCGLGCGYQSADSPDKMVQCLDQALSEVDSLLQDDPTNLEHLFLAARLNNIYIWQLISSGKSPEKQIQNALESYQTLASFDPGNELFLSGQAGTHWARAHYLWGTGQLGKAVAACDLALTRFAADPPTTATLSDALRQLTLTAGYLEAEMGNIEGTRRRLDELRGEDPWTEAMDKGYEKSERKWILLMNQAFLVSLLTDWAELERLGRTMLAMEVEITAVAGSNDEMEKERTRQVRLAIANTFLGDALFQQSRFKEATTALNKAFTHFQTTRAVAPYYGFGEWNMCPAAVHLSNARLHLGHSWGVRAPLEWAFTVNEGMLSRTGRWGLSLWSADCAWQLAQALDPDDPDQVARRNEVLKIGRERLIQAFVDQPLPVSKMLEIQYTCDPIGSAESAWRLAQLLDPTVPEDAEQQTVLLTLAADWLDRAATEGNLKPEHQELRKQIEDQLAPPVR